MRGLRFILFLLFLSVLFNLSAHAFDDENADFYKLYPTFKPAADDPWKNRLFTKLPDAVLEQIYERNETNFASKEDFLSAVQMTGSQQQLKRMDDFAYDDRILIGMGEEGRVHLARHIPTGSYMAVKTPVRKSECKAFKNLGRCYACFVEDITPTASAQEPIKPIEKLNFDEQIVQKISSENTLIASSTSLPATTDLTPEKKENKKIEKYYLYMPFIMGTPISVYRFNQEELDIEVDAQNKVSYNNWPHNLRLLDAFLAELERCIKHKGIPQELDPKSMFVIDEFSEEPKVVFVDLDKGEYKEEAPDYVPDEFCVPMFLLLGSQNSARMRKLVFPEPIQNFFERASKAERGFFRLTKLKEARNQLMIEMQQLGYPGLSPNESSVSESSVSSGQASSSSQLNSSIILQPS